MTRRSSSRDLPILLFALLAATAPGGAAAPASPAVSGDVAGLTGDWSGRRPALAARGVDFGLDYTLAALGNVAGGLRRGALLEGAADLSAAFDFEKLGGLPGLTGRAAAVVAHGPSITAKYVGDVRWVSDYDLADGAFLDEVWLEHTWAGGAASLRAGKLSADSEYVVYGTGDSIPLPLYPVGALGVRLRVAPSGRWTFEAALYDGDPFAPGRDRDRRGLNFRLSRHDGATWLGAVHFHPGVDPDAVLPPGTWKFGAYGTTRDVPDVTTGEPLRGSRTVFVDLAQTLWRERPADAADAQGLSLYVSSEIASADRNTYRSSLQAGLTRTGLLPGRDADILDVSFYYTRFSGPFSRRSVADGGPAYSGENALRLFYRFALTPACTLQPQVDHVFRPGGTGDIPDATVLSLRATFSL
jgi:porin